MSFVCEWCADGLSADEIDEHATHPDAALGGTDPKSGGHLCKGCAVRELEADEREAVIERFPALKGAARIILDASCEPDTLHYRHGGVVVAGFDLLDDLRG